jgi:Xaa-Pro aminopeptidase
MRFVGHAIGLELNEAPALARGVAMPLVEGAVIAVEPKLVFPGLGAVGVENSYVVRAGGPERLTLAGDDPIRVEP